MVSVIAIGIAFTAAFVWDYHQQRHVELPKRRREWHLLRLLGTVTTGISALWFALAETGHAGPRPLVQGTRIELTPFGILRGSAWSEGLPPGAPVFEWVGRVGLIILVLCTLGIHWARLLRLLGPTGRVPPQ